MLRISVILRSVFEKTERVKKQEKEAEKANITKGGVIISLGNLKEVENPKSTENKKGNPKGCSVALKNCGGLKEKSTQKVEDETSKNKTGVILNLDLSAQKNVSEGKTQNGDNDNPTYSVSVFLKLNGKG